MKSTVTYSQDIQYITVIGTLTYYACVLEATVPQGWEHQTLAISIKEMLVSGGGGEVAVFHINFCLLSKVDNFLVWCSSFARHLQKSLASMFFSKLTQVCNKSVYFVIIRDKNQ